jgi:hypothetical protein
MLEILKYTCESLGHFIAVCLLIGWIAFCAGWALIGVAAFLDEVKKN